MDFAQQNKGIRDRIDPTKAPRQGCHLDGADPTDWSRTVSDSTQADQPLPLGEAS